MDAVTRGIVLRPRLDDPNGRLSAAFETYELLAVVAVGNVDCKHHP
jgi:hypothetical protein